MKKILLTLVTVSVLGLGANAQANATTATEASKFSIGPNVGYGSTTISNVDNSKFKAAAKFGIAMVYSAAEHFGIGADIKYSIEGAKSETNNVKNEIDLHYLRVPIKAMYFFNNYGSRVRPKIFAGPELGFLSSAKVNASGGDIDIKDQTEKFDIGLNAGVGLNYRLVNRSWLNFDLGYYHGFKEIFKPVAGSTQADYSNRNLTLNVGVNFGL